MARVDRLDVSQKIRSSVRPLATSGYEDLIRVFHAYDGNRNGRIDFHELRRLMSSLQRHWSDDMTAEVLRAFDADGGGDIDITEFVSFLLPRKTAMAGTGAGLSDYDMLVEQFRIHDSDMNGTLDKHEFHHLMMTLRNGNWSPQSTEAVFDSVDKNHSGTLDVGELIAWTLDVHRPSKAQRRASISESQRGGKVKVIIEAITSRRGEKHADFLEKRWSKAFGGAVVVKKVVDPEDQGAIVKRVAILDTDVVFWDRTMMMAYREDPFASEPTRRHFAEELERGFIPQLIQSVESEG
jgi:Ca2+-binding EF-hand superfamily protein